MRWVLIFSFLLALVLTPLERTEAAVNIGVSIGEEGLRGFYLAVGDYFRVPEREVIIVRERRMYCPHSSPWSGCSPLSSVSLSRMTSGLAEGYWDRSTSILLRNLFGTSSDT